MKRKQKRYITASEIGSAAYCGAALHNQHNGVKSSRLNQSHIRRGNIAHEELSREVVQEARRQNWFIRLLKWLWRVVFR